MSDFVEMANNTGKRTLLNLRFVVGIKEEDDGRATVALTNDSFTSSSSYEDVRKKVIAEEGDSDVHDPREWKLNCPLYSGWYLFKIKFGDVTEYKVAQLDSLNDLSLFKKTLGHAEIKGWQLIEKTGC